MHILPIKITLQLLYAPEAQSKQLSCFSTLNKTVDDTHKKQDMTFIRQWDEKMKQCMVDLSQDQY